MTAQVLIFRVPLPPSALSPNHVIGSLGARQAKHQRAERYREEVRAIALTAAREAGWVIPQRARLSLTYGVAARKGETKMFPKALDRPYRPHDWDNAVAAFKAGQDGLVAVPAKTDKNGVHWPAIPGVLVGDDRKHLEGGRVTFEPDEGPWVQVTLEAIA